MIAISLGFTSSALAAGPEVAVCPAAAAGHARCDADVLAGRHRHRRPALATRGGQPSAGSPRWLQQAYDLTWLSAHRGSGDTVAVVDAYDAPLIASDLATFRAAYGLPACTAVGGCLRVVNQRGQSGSLPAANAGWATEETLDLESVSAICPNCRLLLVEANSSNSTDLATAMQTAVDLGADQISDSWSITDTQSPFAADFLVAQAGRSLPAIFAASGDAGSDPVGAAQYPAALPTVTAVGGTTLSESDSATDPRGYSESAWAKSGSGCATNEAPLPYQPHIGCSGRAFADVSADANPSSGLEMFDAADGGWELSGGTSLATPMVAAFDALTDVASSSPAWAYADARLLNDPTGGSTGRCAGEEALVCTAGAGYDGPTGAGSISGDVVAGAPGIAGPTFDPADTGTAVAHATGTSAALRQGIYTNGSATTYAWQYGTTRSYGMTSPERTIGAAVGVTSVRTALAGLKPGVTYHYRLVVHNSAGTVIGPDMSFTTA